MSLRTLKRSFYASLEWRFVAFAITFTYAYVVLDRSLGQSAAFSFGLQLILLGCHTIWLALRRP